MVQFFEQIKKFNFAMQNKYIAYIKILCRILLFYDSVFFLDMSQQENQIQFVNRPQFDCDCPVCFEPFKESQEVCQTTCCGSHICLGCTTRLKYAADKCPNCRREDIDAIVDKFFLRLYQNLEVRCYNSHAGCVWTGELRYLDEHAERNCQSSTVHRRAMISCPNRCASPRMQRDAVKDHLESDCPLRAVLPAIGVIPIAANGEISIAPFSFTMTNYQQHLNSGEPWYSPSFYTHQEGYRLIVRVDANLHMKSHHLSVHVCILKGDYDDQLQWPLQAKVEISLHNWRESDTSITKSIYLPGDEYCKQVHVDEIALWGKGMTDFVSNEELQYQPSKNTQYISYECLSFRVERIKILPKPLSTVVLPPWAKRNYVNHFVLDSFERSKNIESTQFFGPLFYTHENGYKLAVVVYPNGSGAGTGTHVSVFATLMKTDHDNFLIWPFNGELKIELINWRGDHSHKSRTIMFDGNAPMEATTKPLFDFSNSLHGYEKFIMQSQLAYNQSTNTEYLCNDCLIFKVAFAVAYSTPFWREQGLGYTSALEFTLDKFTIRNLHQNPYYSGPFFSNGYKMQICVKGNVKGYFSVYVHLMKGPNDDYLIWPFCGDVLMEIVNWIDETNHFTKLIQFSPHVNSNACDRVIVGDKNKGVGHAQFIHYSLLTGSFFYDETLYFRVKEVIIHSNELSLMRPRWQQPDKESPFCEFTIVNVSKLMERSTYLYSPKFSTHFEGYKLCIEIQFSSSKQEISVHARLQKGENDENLIWPFEASIVVQLLNWREDACHHTFTIDFDEDSPIESKTQVTTGDSAPSGLGAESFISYHSLKYNGNADTQYLHDDCLRFKVKEAIVYSTPSSFKAPLWQHMLSNYFEITLTRFMDRVRLGSPYLSPPFYTSARGYRLRFHVHSVTRANGENILLYINCFLMKGVHDDELQWPITADVVIDLLNWNSDSNHYRVVLQFNDDSHNGARSRVVVEGVELSQFCIQSKAIPINELFPAYESNTQYLVDDNMRIRIYDTAIYSTHLEKLVPDWMSNTGWFTNKSALLEESVTGVHQHMAYKTKHLSKPFYTHRNGYKLRLEISPYGTGKDVTINARLLKGEFDQKLRWPMDIDITIEIMNWQQNNFHILKLICFKYAFDDTRMPVSGTEEAAKNAWGLPDFCPHHQFFTNTPNIQYIYNNCMFIKVRGAIIR